MMRLAFTVLKCQYATKDMSFCYRLRHKLSTASSLACTRRSINGSAMSSLLLPLQKAHDGKATIFTLLTPLYSYSDGAGLPVLLCYLVTASRCPVSSKLILRPRMPPRFCLLPLKSLTSCLCYTILTSTTCVCLLRKHIMSCSCLSSSARYS
jgi:hypothetical protein